jgi:predicted DNA repair protein MutK
VRTDFILSARSWCISLNEVAARASVRGVILAVVAVGITVLVYGVVGLIVKMDDAGLRCPRPEGRAWPPSAAGWSRGMPKLLSALTVIGHRRDAVGRWPHPAGRQRRARAARPPYGSLHHLEELAHDATGALGGSWAWLVDTAASAIVGSSSARCRAGAQPDAAPRKDRARRGDDPLTRRHVRGVRSPTVLGR